MGEMGVSHWLIFMLKITYGCIAILCTVHSNTWPSGKILFTQISLMIIYVKCLFIYWFIQILVKAVQGSLTYPGNTGWNLGMHPGHCRTSHTLNNLVYRSSLNMQLNYRMIKIALCAIGTLLFSKGNEALWDVLFLKNNELWVGIVNLLRIRLQNVILLLIINSQ